MAKLYVFNLQSQELRGSTTKNALRMYLDSDDDAALFKTNLESLFSADVASVTTDFFQDFSLPYPAGSDLMARVDLVDDDERHSNQVLYDLDDTQPILQLGGDLIGAGILLPYGAFPAVVRASVATFEPKAAKF